MQIRNKPNVIPLHERMGLPDMYVGLIPDAIREKPNVVPLHGALPLRDPVLGFPRTTSAVQPNLQKRTPTHLTNAGASPR